ncbi:MAG: hypothetical protein GY719_21745 [bacterium]|nr:hypothetical protein [bacterium]
MVIRKVGVRSLANMLAAIYVVIGFIGGAIVMLAALTTGELAGGAFPLAIIWAPLLYGALGYVGGALVGWVYNRAAAFAGGIEIELEAGEERGSRSSTAGVMIDE